MSSETPASNNEDHSQPQSSQLQPTASSKPPVSIQPGSHLDPGAYVRGSFPISIGQNVLVHPRAHLLSIHSPLIIGDGCVISEKCIVGGPLPPTNSSDTSTDAGVAHKRTKRNESLSLKATVVEDLVHLHTNVTIGHGATLKASCIIEPNVVIDSDVVVGSHSKVCSNTMVSTDIPDWVVTWGSSSGQSSRMRKTHFPGSQSDAYLLVERARISVMERERDGTVSILKAAASKTLSGNSRNKK